MSLTRVATRYAKSLVDLAVEQNKLDRIKEDMAAFDSAMDNRDFYLMVKSPIINPEKKKSIFNAIFGKQFDELSMSFLNLLVTKGRETDLPEVSSAFMEQYREINHITPVKLITAKKLSEEAVEQIRQRLLTSGSTHENVQITTEVDPSLIGGFVLEFDNKLYDASVAHKLETLKKEISDKSFIASI